MERIEIMKSIVSNINNGVFVEIGTHKGEFAEHILSSSLNSTLYCIDPYMKYDTYNDAMNDTSNDALFNEVQTRLKNIYGDRIIFIRKMSNDAVNLIPNHIDFLYIDGNHQYEYVYNDLELYYPKVKQNCYIMGDDAVDRDEHRRSPEGNVYIEWCPGHFGNYGVIKAFRDFIKNNSLKEGRIYGTQYLMLK